MSSKLLIDERPLTVLPSLVKLVGMERAVILQQIHWLLKQPKSGIMHEGHKWVWGTHEEWCVDYFSFWKPDTLRKHLTRLEEDGWIHSAQIKGFDRTKHYRVNYEKVDSPNRHDHATWKRHDHATSKSHDDATSKREDRASSKRHDHDSSYITETSTKTTQKTSNTEKKKMNECARVEQDLAETSESIHSFFHFDPDAGLDTTIDPERSYALLTDPEVRMDHAGAERLAENYGFEYLVLHVFEWLAGKGGPYGEIKSLIHRIQSEFTTRKLIEGDFDSDLFRRHFPDYEHRRYSKPPDLPTRDYRPPPDVDPLAHIVVTEGMSCKEADS